MLLDALPLCKDIKLHPNPLRSLPEWASAPVATYYYVSVETQVQRLCSVSMPAFVKHFLIEQIPVRSQSVVVLARVDPSRSVRILAVRLLKSKNFNVGRYAVRIPTMVDLQRLLQDYIWSIQQSEGDEMGDLSHFKVYVVADPKCSIHSPQE